jgi:hypothetical protein
VSGRIRSIKPEWLEDERLAESGTLARLLSVALIVLADDHGRGRANEVVLAAKVFAYEPNPIACVREALARLSRIEFVRLYTVRGQHYYHIRNWAKHQRVDKPGKPRFPGPDEGDSGPAGAPPDPAPAPPDGTPLARDSGESRESLAPDRRSVGATERRIDGPTREGASASRGTPTAAAPSNVVDFDPLKRARRLLEEGYQRRHEAAVGEPWMGSSGAFTDIGTCAALVAAKPERLTERAEALLDAVFADRWLAERHWPWSAIAKNPARYLASERSDAPKTETEAELEKLDRAMERAIQRGNFDEQDRLRKQLDDLQRRARGAK